MNLVSRISLQHSHPQSFANSYIQTVQMATAAGKPVILLETNTASCNGFLGLSDGFSAGGTNLLFENNYVANGDDCLTVGSGASNITFRQAIMIK